MKKIYFSFLFLFIGLTLHAQECKQTCEVEKQNNQGVFLGVEIYNTPKVKTPKIKTILEGTQAEAMGLQKGDIIYTINGTKMEDTPFMVDWIGQQKAGDAVAISLQRKGKDMVIKGELGFKTMETFIETICCDKSTGVLELKASKIFPNPSRGEFTLQFEVEKESPINASIVDFNGNVIQELTIYPKGSQVNESIVLDAQVSGDHLIILNQDGLITERRIVFIK